MEPRIALKRLDLEIESDGPYKTLAILTRATVRLLRFLRTTDDLTKFQGAGEEPESRKAKSPAYMTCENLNKSEGVYKNTHRIKEKAFNSLWRVLGGLETRFRNEPSVQSLRVWLMSRVRT